MITIHLKKLPRARTSRWGDVVRPCRDANALYPSLSVPDLPDSVLPAVQDQANRDTRANQLNRDNRANQLNPNHPEYKGSGQPSAPASKHGCQPTEP